MPNGEGIGVTGRLTKTTVMLPGGAYEVAVNVCPASTPAADTAGIGPVVTTTPPVTDCGPFAVRLTLGSRWRVPVVDTTAGTGPFPPLSIAVGSPVMTTCERSTNTAALADTNRFGSPPRMLPPAIDTSDWIAVRPAPPVGVSVATPCIEQSENATVEVPTDVCAMLQLRNETATLEPTTTPAARATFSNATMPRAPDTASEGLMGRVLVNEPPRMRNSRPAGSPETTSPLPRIPSACRMAPGSHSTAMPLAVLTSAE